jgi:hypothetical protein
VLPLSDTLGEARMSAQPQLPRFRPVLPLLAVAVPPNTALHPPPALSPDSAPPLDDALKKRCCRPKHDCSPSGGSAGTGTVGGGGGGGDGEGDGGEELLLLK